MKIIVEGHSEGYTDAGVPVQTIDYQQLQGAKSKDRGTAMANIPRITKLRWLFLGALATAIDNLKS